MRHGTYWTIAPGQVTEGLLLFRGEPEKEGDLTVPLRTIEAPAPFDETEERFESVRYFQKARV